MVSFSRHVSIPSTPRSPRRPAAQTASSCARTCWKAGARPARARFSSPASCLQIKLHVIIRPRGGDFCYSEAEFEAMKLDIALCKQAGADGVVIGILHPDGTVDRERTAELIALARPLSVTFHRAFDMTRDPYAASRP